MRLKQVIILGLLPLLLNTTVSFSAQSEVTWSDPDNYRDIREGDQIRSRFRASVFKAFNEHFDKLSKKLPDGLTLKFDVTDLDLAGDVQYGHINNVRIVQEVYIPSITFSYQLLDSDKSVISEGNVKLNDKSFLISNAALFVSDDLYRYEKRMIDKWFNMKFHEQIKSKN